MFTVRTLAHLTLSATAPNSGQLAAFHNRHRKLLRSQPCKIPSTLSTLSKAGVVSGKSGAFHSYTPITLQTNSTQFLVQNRCWTSSNPFSQPRLHLSPESVLTWRRAGRSSRHFVSTKGTQGLLSLPPK